jgi:putative peptide zinc metalloprotease protein
MDRLGDGAPTQGEVINLLGQLHGSNLLQGNWTPNAEELFQRHQRRLRREVSGFFLRLFFIRIPLWDPDRFLDTWTDLVGKLFNWYGFLIWAVIVGAGLWAVGGHSRELANQASGVLNPENLPLLYAALVLVKIFHEMAHAFSCKHFGRLAGTGGEVHQMGVTLLVFTPLPFVDATSAWALRNKVHRVVIGASGMLAELVIASIAAILWTRTAEATTVNVIAYNIMIVASVSTLLFNGNPFLRYDAYYILLDVLEIPNLDSRSRLYFIYLVKRYIWGVRNAHDPSHTVGERGWLIFYAVASTICRVIVFSAIILFLASKFIVIGVAFALIMLIGWVLLPMGKALRYLVTSPELDRFRVRAVLTSSVSVLSLLIAFGLIRVPDRCLIEGVVEPVEFAAIHMETAGFVKHVLDSGVETGPDGPRLIAASNFELEAHHHELLAELHQLQIRRQLAQTREAAAAHIIEEKMAALEEQIQRNNQNRQALTLKSPISGTWVGPDKDRIRGTYLRRGQHLGIVANLNNLRIRAIAGQKVAAQLIKEAQSVVRIRVRGQPNIELTGLIDTIIPAGHERLPSAALGYAAGGATLVDPKEPSGRQASEPFFEILVLPLLGEASKLRPGQTVLLRLDTLPKPLLVQGYRSLLQVFQRRFQV